MKRIALALTLLLGLADAAIAGGTDYAAEPPGIWTGPMQGAVPATLSGGRVIDVDEVAALVKNGDAVLIDVSAAPRRPEGLDPSSVWLPPPHHTIPGSVWLAGIGRGELAAGEEAWYRDRLQSLTGGDKARTIVLFCHPNCWGSWNAAKRAVLYGYTDVRWYPGGIEGWQDSGRPTETVEAEPTS